MRYTNYIERRAALLGEGIRQLDETWRKKHGQAMAIFDVEAIYADMIHLVDNIFERDNLIHLETTKKRDAKLLQDWNRSLNQCLQKILQAMVFLQDIIKQMDAMSYQGITIDPKKLVAYKKRVETALYQPLDFADRPDIDQAIQQAERDVETGSVTED